MVRMGVFCWILFQTLFVVGSNSEPAWSRETPVRRVLKVSMYPIIPDVKGAAWMIEEAFEKKYPQIDLQISFAPKYYNHQPGKGGIIDQVADVYELDSVFLADFVAKKKIRPIAPASAAMIPFARTAATYRGITYGIPHWVCGNFLIYRTSETGLQQARTLSDVERVIGSQSSGGGLLIDLKGTSTLGEMYLDGLMDRYKSAAALERLKAQEIDRDVVDAIKRALKLAQPSFGRDEDYHYRAGFYGRQFARGNGRALVGYSEQLYYVLTEASQSCRHDEKNCLDPAPKKHTSQIAVTEWPLSDSGSQPIGWVDLFVVSATARGQVLRDALTFINFMIDKKTYRMLLVPDSNLGEMPRYLLPAREDVYADPGIRAAAPLYESFRKAIGNAIPVTDSKLNERLRTIGSSLDGLLPRDN